MNFTKKLSLTLASAALCALTYQPAAAQDQQAQQQQPAQAPAATQAQQAASLDELLNLVEAAQLTETEEQREREQRFRENVAQQQALLNEMQETQATEERISTELEAQYNENEVIIAQRFDTLQERLGDLDELFGTIAGVVGDTMSTFETSLVSAQFPGRIEFLSELAGVLSSDSDLPSTAELERLWFYLLQEITESGKIVAFDNEVAQPDGTQASQEVVRIGTYNMVSDGQYLQYDGNTDRLSVLARQPEGYGDGAAALQASESGYTQVGIDPTGPQGGSFMGALISYPTFMERVEQGGTIGNVIMVLGAIAFLLAIERLFTLSLIGAKVNSQLKNTAQPKKNNPLGRVLMVYENDKTMDIETLELKLGEAILQETPRLERFQTLIKIISTVGPLLGLLGTVTGMITVFQAITLFGTGDPQVMAGGISAALVTTVQGLCVAIPAVLLYTMVKGRSDKIIHVMEEQATGIIARKAEAEGGLRA